MTLISNLIERIKRISFSRQIEIIAMLIGLTVDVITLLSYIGAINTPPDSPNFYVNSQDFLVWSLIAVIYGLGFINAKIMRRWRRLYKQRRQENTKRFFLSYTFGGEMWNRHFALSVITSFPLTFLYIRAAMAAGTNGTASPWTALLLTAFVGLPAALGMLVVAYGFDKALSLYSGEGDQQEEILE